MQTDPFYTGSVLSWHRTQTSTAHQSELRRLKRVWITLPSDLLQTRYQLNALDLSFSDTEPTITIQSVLRQSLQSIATEYNQHYLIAEPHADAPCYNISDHIQKCVAGDLAIAERLRGRTLINLYQTETMADDLFNRSGVSKFIARLLIDYLRKYGKQHLVGFTCELPKFLSLVSVLSADMSSVPWISMPLKAAEESYAMYLPLVFYETYNSAAVRNTFWKVLTNRFATCFLRGVRDFCRQEGLQFALRLPGSAKALEYELGALLAEVDIPILNATEIDTPKRLVGAKWVCSDTQVAGIDRRKNNDILMSRYFEDASLGFNLWMNRSDVFSGITQQLSTGYPKRSLLIVAPTQSLWTKPDEKSWNAVTKAWGWLCQRVWELGYDFRIVSEQELASAEVISAASAKNLGIPRGGVSFPNSRSDATTIYSVTLIPSCISLQKETVECLKAFTKAKGRLIIDEPVPYLLNGRIGLEPYPLERLIYGRRVTILRGPPDEKTLKLTKCLRKWVTRRVSVYVKPGNTETDTVQILHRETEESETFYLFNTNSEPIDTLIEVHRDASRVSEWDLLKGTTENIEFWNADGKTYLNSPFTPKQGRIFVVS